MSNAPAKYRGQVRKVFGDAVNIGIKLENPRKIGKRDYYSRDGNVISSERSAETPIEVCDYRFRMTILVVVDNRLVSPVFPVEHEEMEDDGTIRRLPDWSSTTGSAATRPNPIEWGFAKSKSIRRYFLVLSSFTEKTGDRVFEVDPKKIVKGAILMIPDFLKLPAVGTHKRGSEILNVILKAENEEKVLYQAKSK